jgi:hypothetical protein
MKPAQPWLSYISLACAAVTALLYYLLVWTRVFKESLIYEGWVFLAHVALAVVGLGLAVFGIRKHPVLCAVSALVCGYFVLIQLVL